jgi:hypothetical protein
MSLRLWIVVGLLGLLASLPAAGTDLPTGAACGPATSAQLGTPDPSLQAGHGGGIEDPGELAVCNAQCWDGSYVTCWGTSCWGSDSNCSSNFRGYCYGTSTSYRYCPVCPSTNCRVTAACEGGTSVSCTGSCANSFAVDYCYAFCDGVYHWCPSGPGGPYICPV